MDCQPFREALSAIIDGEDPGMAWDDLQRHLADCGVCRRWSDDVNALNASLPLIAADAVPDLSDAVFARIAPLAPTGPAAPLSPGREQRPWRVALALVALAQLGLALPALLLGADAGVSPHLAQELGSWDVALAVGFLFAAWRPARAWGMLPLVAALVVCLAATSGVGLAEGEASVLRESSHVLDLAGLPLLWVLARDSRPRIASLRLA